MRLHRLIAVTWLMLVCALGPAHAEKRVALVVGNAAYRHAGKLNSPVNDAQAMRDALKKLGFDVIYGENLDLKDLRRAIGQFGGRVEDADVAIVYFSGHGSAFDGTSYVVPVDAKFANLAEVPHELMPVEMLIGDLRRAKGARIAILDACRDNSAEKELKRSRGGAVARELAPMRDASGLIVAYATQYGATAAGGRPAPGGLFSWTPSSAGHGLFTAALLNKIATPGLDVKDMFYEVARDVIDASGGTQRPEISISMDGSYPLTPAADLEDTLVIDTTRGRVFVKLRTDLAPIHAERLKQLAHNKFYDNVPFHQVIPGLLDQTGEGANDKSMVPFKFRRGIVIFPRTNDPLAAIGFTESANSQLLVMYDHESNDQYMVVGEVLSGMDVVDKLNKGNEADPEDILHHGDRAFMVRVAADVITLTPRPRR